MDLKKFLPSAAICISMLISCQSPGNNELAATNVNVEVAAQKGGVISLPQNRLAEKLKNEQIQLVDVRTVDEVNQGIIPGAVHIDYLDQNTFQLKSQELDTSRPVIVYCASGGRSQKAALWLSENGFYEVYDLEGGYNSWDGGQ